MVDTLSIKELITKDLDQLQKILAERQEHFRHLRFQISSKEVKNHRELRFLRREIARIQTVITHKKSLPAEPATSTN